MDKAGSPTKYSMIYKDIRDKILGGAILPGEKIASENMLCKQYDVSRYTVRRALADLIGEGLVEARHGQGTFCTLRRISGRRTHNIAVITTYLSDYIFPSVIRGIDRVMTDNGYTMFLKNTGNSQKNEARCLEEMMGKGVDGLIIEPSRSEVFCKNEPIYKELDAMGIPYVFIQGRYQQLKSRPCVLLNERRGGYLAAKHLIDTNHKNIAGIFKMDDYQGTERYKGFVQAFNDGHVPLNPDYTLWFHTEDRRVKPMASVAELLEQKNPVDGIVCYNDQIAVSVLNGLRALGYRVPEDISIVGYDNSSLAVNATIGLTSVNHPKEQLGEAAARMLLDLINGTADMDHCKKIMEPELIIRESCLARPVV